jgi:hypothetical protein
MLNENLAKFLENMVKLQPNSWFQPQPNICLSLHYSKFLQRLNPTIIFIWEKVYIPSPTYGGGVRTTSPNWWNSLFQHLNFSKSIKLPLKQFWKIIINHRKIIKWKIKFDSTWVDLHSEYIIWYALGHFLQLQIN